MLNIDNIDTVYFRNNCIRLMELSNFKEFYGIIQDEKGVLMNHEIITNELTEDTKALIAKLENMEAEISER